MKIQDSEHYEDWMINWLFCEERDVEGIYQYSIYFCYAPDSLEPVFVSLSLDEACKYLKRYEVNE